MLDYPLHPSRKHKKKNNKSLETSVAKTPCGIYNDFLSQEELEQLKSIFEDPKASYWTDHCYQVEPPSPYFSYVIPFNKKVDKFGFVGRLVQKIWKMPELRKKFPELKDAKFVEMWAHNRPHPSGHQMHFDSDDEGRGGIRNPIISTIIYVTANDASDNGGGGGGPSLVTNQTLSSTSLATRAWLAHPQEGRLVAFDGSVLHGVVPGKGAGNGRRRVTIMFAFWKAIHIRNGHGPGSARPFPPQKSKDCPQWVQDLTNPSVTVQQNASVVEEAPIVLDHVYETLDGEPWRPKYGMPDYEQVFQGF